MSLPGGCGEKRRASLCPDCVLRPTADGLHCRVKSCPKKRIPGRELKVNVLSSKNRAKSVTQDGISVTSSAKESEAQQGDLYDSRLSQPGLHGEFQDSKNYTERLYLKKKKKKPSGIFEIL